MNVKYLILHKDSIGHIIYPERFDKPSSILERLRAQKGISLVSETNNLVLYENRFFVSRVYLTRSIVYIDSISNNEYHTLVKVLCKIGHNLHNSNIPVILMNEYKSIPLERLHILVIEAEKYLSANGWFIRIERGIPYTFLDKKIPNEVATLAKKYPNAEITYEIWIRKDANYTMWAYMRLHDELGTLRCYVDDKFLTELVIFANNSPYIPEYKLVKLGNIFLTKGKHIIRLVNSEPFRGLGYQNIDYLLIVEDKKLQESNDFSEKIIFKMLNPVRYEVHIFGVRRSFILVLAEHYNKWWKVYNGSINWFEALFKKPIIDENHHFIANGYYNAWYIPINNTRELVITIYFWPQSIFYVCLFISLMSISAFIITLILKDVANTHKQKILYKKLSKRFKTLASFIGSP